MANAQYNAFKDALLNKTHGVGDTWRAYLIDLADYTFSQTHTTIADIPAAAREEVVTLTGVAASNGLVTANNYQFAGAAGDESEAIIYTVDNTTSEVPVIFLDTGVTGLPVILNSGDVDVNCSAGIVQI